MIYKNLTIEQIDAEISKALSVKNHDKVYYLIQERAKRFSKRHKVSEAYLLSLAERSKQISTEFARLAKLIRNRK